MHPPSDTPNTLGGWGRSSAWGRGEGGEPLGSPAGVSGTGTTHNPRSLTGSRPPSSRGRIKPQHPVTWMSCAVSLAISSKVRLVLV